ncbi:MAG: NAD(P)/FAD-dependent oxidoreductase [Phycisphaerae bacterium]|nr:NAD(P)/FAD-dependent oxidoreductase [Phycisphaerae bacterium]
MSAGSGEVFDVTIVGGGPTGLFAAFYAGLRGMRVRIIDSLELLGGQLTTLYPDKIIYDVAGFPAILAKTLVEELIRQMTAYGPTVVLGEQVLRLTHGEPGLLRLDTDRDGYPSRSVVIAAGAGAFTPKRLPGFDLDGYEGKGVSYFVRDLADWRGRRVLIIGGGDSAVDWSLNLLRVTQDITTIHRAADFRAHEDSVAKLRASPVRLLTFHELKAVHGRDRVEAATIYDNRTREERFLEVDEILISIGFSTSLGPIREWGLNLDKSGIVVTSRMETSMAGVFAAGDVASYPGKLKLIVTGFGEAATAVNHAKAFIDPASKSFPGHSSALVPKQRKAVG